VLQADHSHCSAHDHFRLLLESLGSSASASAVALDYDCRTPAPAFERSAETARAELLKIKRQLQQAFGERAELMEKQVRLAATTPARLDFGTTVGREVSALRLVGRAACAAQLHLLGRSEVSRAKLSVLLACSPPADTSSVCSCGSSACTPSTTTRLSAPSSPASWASTWGPSSAWRQARSSTRPSAAKARCSWSSRAFFLHHHAALHDLSAVFVFAPRYTPLTHSHTSRTPRSRLDCCISADRCARRAAGWDTLRQSRWQRRR